MKQDKGIQRWLTRRVMRARWAAKLHKNGQDCNVGQLCQWNMILWGGSAPSWQLHR